MSIILHNIPEGIAIAVPIYFSTKKRSRVLLFLIISSLGEVIGSFISLFLIKNNINYQFMGYILISISIMMILIAIVDKNAFLKFGASKFPSLS